MPFSYANIVCTRTLFDYLAIIGDATIVDTSIDNLIESIK